MRIVASTSIALFLAVAQPKLPQLFAVQIVGSEANVMATADANGVTDSEDRRPTDLSVFELSAVAEAATAAVQSSSNADMNATFHPHQLAVELSAAATSSGGDLDHTGSSYSESGYELHFRATRPTRLQLSGEYDLTLGDGGAGFHLQNAETSEVLFNRDLHATSANSVAAMRVVPPGEYRLAYSAFASAFTESTPDSRATLSTFVSFVDGPAMGDFTGDQRLTLADLNQITIGMLQGDPRFDLDGDVDTDLDDRLVWVRDLKGTWIGDANFDGSFNSTDLIEVFAAGKYDTIERADWSEGDWNGDSLFDSSDVILAFADGGYDQGPRSAVQAVPEPASVALLAMGATVLLARHRVSCRLACVAGK